MDYLRTFCDVLQATGRDVGDADAWVARVREGIEQGKAELWPIGVGGVMVGGVLLVADTVHVAVLPEYHGRWVTKRLRRAYDTWTHTGRICAPIKPDNRKAVELATRLGFRFSQDQGLYHLYVKEPKP